MVFNLCTAQCVQLLNSIEACPETFWYEFVEQLERSLAHIGYRLYSNGLFVNY